MTLLDRINLSGSGTHIARELAFVRSFEPTTDEERRYKEQIENEARQRDIASSDFFQDDSRWIWY